jgi:hypothetical protein
MLIGVLIGARRPGSMSSGSISATRSPVEPADNFVVPVLAAGWHPAEQIAAVRRTQFVVQRMISIPGLGSA